MILFTLSFIREFLGNTKSKLFINHKDTLGAMVLFFILITSETMTPIVLGIPITKAMFLRMLGLATAGFTASLLSSKVVNKALNKIHKAKPYEFVIKFKNPKECELIKEQLDEQGIKVSISKNHKRLFAISLKKEHSNVIKTIIDDKFKSYSVKEFVEYKKK